MIDTQRVKDNCDLRRLVEQDLGSAPLHGGRAHLWKCPFHHERKGFSLAVWPNGYRCFGACDTSGDALDWLMNYRRLSFVEALCVMGEPVENAAPLERKRLNSSTEPPEPEWQQAAERIVSTSEEILWSGIGESALNYLTGRGLTTQTIRAARLGYIPGDFREWRTIEGLDVPCGITIPWFAANALWSIKVRRAVGTPKYQQVRGGNSNGLYGADHLVERKVALFCEGEFDTLIVCQEGSDLVTPITLGSAVNPLASRWLSEFLHCSLILVAYDSDTAGERGAQRLLNVSPRFRKLNVPFGKDIGEFYQQGGDLYRWIESELHDTDRKAAEE